MEGLLANTSDIQPGILHADTQGQALPVYGVAHMLGFELLPRIRNWADLIFYRPSPPVRYRHIDSLFGPDAVIDWNLIAAHWQDLMRVALSIRAGRISLGRVATPARSRLPPQPAVPRVPRGRTRHPYRAALSYVESVCRGACPSAVRARTEERS